MQILKEIKLSRLVLAIAITLFIADTMPHPSLSGGFLENSLALIQGEPTATTSRSDMTITNHN